MPLSQSMEDYLKAIYTIETEEQGAATKQIADRLEVSSASATNMVKRLAGMELVDYESYKGARLTESGRKMALEIIRHHRLLELYLLEVMGYSWDEVHDEAENLEHYISEQFEEKIVELLDNPTHDPHGDPIPTKEGILPKVDEQSLVQAQVDQPYIIKRIKHQDPERLRYLEKNKILPGAKILVVNHRPFKEPLTVKIEDEERVIGNEIAQNIYVAKL